MRSSLIFVFLASLVGSEALAQSDRPTDFTLERSGIRYSLGSVTLVQNSEAQIDLGEVHGIRKLDQLAVFRRESTHFVPLGLVTIHDVYGVRCRTAPVKSFDIEQGDLVMTVREFFGIPPAEQFRDDYLKREHIRSSTSQSYTTVGPRI